MTKTPNKSIFKSIDNYLTDQISLFRNTSTFQKSSELLRTFSEKEQLAINHLLSVLFVMLPIVAAVVLTIHRMSITSDIEIRKNILNKMISLKSNISLLSQKERNLVASGEAIEDKQAFIQKINQMLESKKIKSSSIIVDNFEFTREGSKVKQIETEIKFKELTSVAYSSLIQDVATKFKAQVTELKTIRDDEKLLLSGSFKISFFSKNE